MDPTPLEPRVPSPLPYRLLLLEAFVLVLLWLHYYPLMPGRMATHFGAGGEANGWMTLDGFLLFFWGMCAFLVVLMLLMPKLIGLFPDSMVNIPHRDYWLAPERRPLVRAILGEHMAWLGVIILGLMGAILHSTFRTNLLEPPRLEGISIGWTMGGFFAAMAVWLVMFCRAFRVPKEPGATR